MSRSIAAVFKSLDDVANINERLAEMYISKQDPNCHVLKFRNKYVWCYTEVGDLEVEFQFSSEFILDERFDFICWAKSCVDFQIEDADIV